MSKRPLVPANIERLAPYVPGKPLSELAREYGVTQAVKLASNESPFGPSPRVLEAASKALLEGHRYPDGFALRAALAEHHGVAIDEIILGDGSNELIDLICRTFAAPGEHAVYPHPSFVCYRSATVSTNMESTVVALKEGVAYDVDAFIAAIRSDTKLIFIANPNNPTGAYFSEEALHRLLSAAPRDAVIVLDEAYVEFVDAADFGNGLALRDAHPQILLLRTFSKAYGLAGLRVGYGIGPAELVAYIDRIRPPFNVNNVGLAAAEAALADSAHLERYIQLNASERRRLAQRFVEMGLTVAPSQTNFLLVDTGRDGRDIYQTLLKKGVVVRPMPAPLVTHVRVSLGLPVENDRLLEVLAGAVA